MNKNWRMIIFGAVAWISGALSATYAQLYLTNTVIDNLSFNMQLFNLFILLVGSFNLVAGFLIILGYGYKELRGIK